MKLTYKLTFEDFCQLQPPFTIRAGHNFGFIGVVAACALIALLGVFCLAKGMGIAVGGFLIGLGFIATLLGYAYDVRGVRRAKEHHAQRIEAAYKQLHCRDARIFEADENGFTASCQCGSVTRPWSEITACRETEYHIGLATKNGWEILPKSGFSSQGDITELRSLVMSRLNENRPVNSRFFDIHHKRRDYTEAKLLHTVQGGGWRRIVTISFRLACLAAGVLVIAAALKPGQRAVVRGMIGIFLAIQLVQMIISKRKPYLDTLRVHFSDTGLHLQDSRGQARHPWAQFIGYLENGQLLLLYHNPRLYRIIPKRALGSNSVDFLTLVKVKIPRYDYQSATKFPLPLEVGSNTRTSA